MVPLSGGAPVTFAGAYPNFEPGVVDPHLVFSSMYDPPALGFARGDGTGATFQTLSGASRLFQWLGSTVIYATGPSDHSLTSRRSPRRHGVDRAGQERQRVRLGAHPRSDAAALLARGRGRRRSGRPLDRRPAALIVLADGAPPARIIPATYLGRGERI